MIPGNSEDTAAADAEFTIDLSDLSDLDAAGVTWNETDTLTFNNTANGKTYEITQTDSSWYDINIIFQTGVNTTLTINNIKIAGDIRLQGNASVKLLLAGASSIEGSVLTSPTASIEIDSAGTAGSTSGSLTVAATDDDNAGIGGGNESAGGNITISGGTVNATGGYYGSGIGGGDGGAGGTITITGGNVTAACDSNGHGSGIGGGDFGAGGTINISGGTVKATGGRFGAGIGGGETGVGGNIAISGGTVNATGGNYGAGIGGGEWGTGGTINISGGTVTAKGGNYGAGIGGGNGRAGGNITISDSIVTATGGTRSAGIGGGNSGAGGAIAINGGTVTATGGISAAGIGGGENGEGCTIAISSTATVKAYSGGVLPAIHASSIGGGYFVNGKIVSVLPSGVSNLLVYAKGNTSTALTTLSLPSGYIGFAFALPGSSSSTDYNLNLQSGTLPILRYTDGDPVIYSISNLTGYNTHNYDAGDGILPLLLGTPPSAFVQVSNITGVPSSMTAGTSLTLTGTVVPSGATYKYISWGVKDAGATGAKISGNTLSVTDVGTVVVTATIANGTSPGVHFTKDFNINVTASSGGDFVPATNITGVPSSATAGTPLTLTGTVVPSDATYKSIKWEVNNAGATGAVISGNTLSTTSAGTVVVTASITDGVSPGVNLTKNFTISVKAAGGGGGGGGTEHLEDGELSDSGSMLLWVVIAVVIIVILAAALFFLHRKGMI